MLPTNNLIEAGAHEKRLLESYSAMGMRIVQSLIAQFKGGPLITLSEP
jgi:hypothetical protein